MATSDKKPALPIDTWGKTWLVVTGASKGFGAEICKCLSSNLGADSVILGIARSMEGLKQTKAAVQNINKSIKFVCSEVDLEAISAQALDKILRESIASEAAFERCVIFHNAASLGDLDYLRNIKEQQKINSYFNLNLSSMVLLNSLFLEISRSPSLSSSKINVINISSLCATLPMKSWGLYCTGKAARMMFFKVLALEEKDIDVLSYCPGPLEGEMQVHARQLTTDPDLKAMFINMKEGNQLLKMSVSVEKMISLLTSGKYSSGDNVDFYDF